MENDLARSLHEELEKIPILDIHSHIKPEKPSAATLAETIFYHYISSELMAAGMPEDDLDPDRDADERIRKALPYLPRIANTSSWWCLRRILQDLYNIEELSEATLDAETPDAADVLNKANVERVMAMVSWGQDLSAVQAEFQIAHQEDGGFPFVPALRLDSLINEPYQSKTMDRLSEAIGDSILEAGDLKKGIKKLISDAARSGCRALACSFEPGVRFERSNRDAADRVLSLVQLGQKTSPDDRRALRSFVLSAVLEAAADEGLTFQLLLGITHIAGNGAAAAFDPELLRTYATIFDENPSVRFDIILGNAMQSHEVAVLCRNFANVYTSGHWWYLFNPGHIARVLRERVEMLPMNKSCGFFSDAYNVDWVYGKAALVRLMLARTLAEMIEEGLLSEETALEVARRYLRDNAQELYFRERTETSIL